MRWSKIRVCIDSIAASHKLRKQDQDDSNVFKSNGGFFKTLSETVFFLGKIAGDDNTSDVLTKAVTWPMLNKHFSSLTVTTRPCDQP